MKSLVKFALVAVGVIGWFNPLQVRADNIETRASELEICYDAKWKMAGREEYNQCVLNPIDLRADFNMPMVLYPDSLAESYDQYMKLGVLRALDNDYTGAMNAFTTAGTFVSADSEDWSEARRGFKAAEFARIEKLQKTGNAYREWLRISGIHKNYFDQ